MAQPLVSVLMPIYGVEKYIERCARSIFEQTYENLEIIFVDDCSPDQSTHIVENVLTEYPNRVPQTRIIRHEKNLGLAGARLTALNAATGKYVQNYDSDDWVTLLMFGWSSIKHHIKTLKNSWQQLKMQINEKEITDNR